MFVSSLKAAAAHWEAALCDNGGTNILQEIRVLDQTSHVLSIQKIQRALCNKEPGFTVSLREVSQSMLSIQLWYSLILSSQWFSEWTPMPLSLENMLGPLIKSLI